MTEDVRVPAAPGSIGCADEAQGLRPSGNDPSRWRAVILDALSERKVIIDACPANKANLGDKACPKCRATTRGPCWESVRADAIFVDAIKGLVA